MAESGGDFRELQRGFAAHLRNPVLHPAPPGIEDRRLAIYRELFFNNISGFLDNGFPVLRAQYREADWQALARDFYTVHRCHSPLFGDIGAEFLDYLNTEHQLGPADPPYLVELAHWEWLEAELATSPAVLPNDVDAEADLLDAVLVLTPLLRVVQYQYPVHRLTTVAPAGGYSLLDAQPTYLAAYRNRADGVDFLVLNATTAMLLERLRDNVRETGRSLLLQLAEQLGHPQPETLLNFGVELLTDLQVRGIVAGARQPVTPL